MGLGLYESHDIFITVYEELCTPYISINVTGGIYIYPLDPWKVASQEINIIMQGDNSVQLG